MTITPIEPVTNVAVFLPTLRVSDDDARALNALDQALSACRTANLLKSRYYDSKQGLKDLGISLPPQLRGIDTVLGWPATAVDVLEERLDFQGWTSTEDLGLDQVYRDNDLDFESGLGHSDTLIFGTGYVAVSTGFDGEPDPLVTVESPNDMVGVYDRRTRRLMIAASFVQ